MPKREEELGAELLRQVERSVMLSVIDNKWREHLSDMDYLRAGDRPEGDGPADPLEYQREAYDMFTEMVESVKRDAVRYSSAPSWPSPRPSQRVEPGPVGPKPATHMASDKIGRNDPCPCGSGKKYKRCHGAAVPSCRARRRACTTMTTGDHRPEVDAGRARKRLVEARYFLDLDAKERERQRRGSGLRTGSGTIKTRHASSASVSPVTRVCSTWWRA